MIAHDPSSCMTTIIICNFENFGYFCQEVDLLFFFFHTKHVGWLSSAVSLFLIFSNGFISSTRYITYSSEYEAARCIQSVHSFVLDGNSLR